MAVPSDQADEIGFQRLTLLRELQQHGARLVQKGAQLFLVHAAAGQGDRVAADGESGFQAVLT